MAVTTSAALVLAMAKRSTPKEAVAFRCKMLFDKDKFSELEESQQWTLVCAIDPDAIGPYGCSMASFDGTEKEED